MGSDVQEDSMRVVHSVTADYEWLTSRPAPVQRPLAITGTMTAGLTEDQRIAFGGIIERIERGERFTKLQGYAGTGKTFLVGKLIDAMAATSHIIYVVAPTHKAVSVIRSKIERRDVEVRTVQSFLGLKLERNGDGGYVLRRDWMKEVPERGIVFADESSMIGANLWQHIQASPERLQWVFVGDPAQLPPVSEAPSPVFTLDGFTLTEVVRQAKGNPIIELATGIREGRTTTVSQVFAEGVGIGTTRVQEDFVARAVHQFKSGSFDDDPTYCRVLAYRNSTVQAYNREIRRRIYGADAPRFVEGEWLVAMEGWEQFGKPYLQNSEEVQVTKVEEDVLYTLDDEWMVWGLEIKSPGDYLTRTILVLHESEHARYRKKLDELRKEARKTKQWRAFYELNEAFARVDYLYAMTVHKSQGSTFHTCFVDWQDLRMCKGSERTALFYVSVTRPSHRLAVLQ